MTDVLFDYLNFDIFGLTVYAVFFAGAFFSRLSDFFNSRSFIFADSDSTKFYLPQNNVFGEVLGVTIDY